MHSCGGIAHHGPARLSRLWMALRMSRVRHELREHAFRPVPDHDAFPYATPVGHIERAREVLERRGVAVHNWALIRFNIQQSATGASGSGKSGYKAALRGTYADNKCVDLKASGRTPREAVDRLIVLAEAWPG
jgi:hypothetical protein